MVFRGTDSDNFLLKSIPQGIPIDGKLYHFKEKFCPPMDPLKWKFSSVEGILSCPKVIPFKGKYSPTNGSVKKKNFFRKWFLLRENCFPLTENNLP